MTAKRAMDIAGAATGLVVSLPVLAAAWLATRWTLGRPVLLRQVRAGLDGRPFVLYKIRTMSRARDQSGRLLPDEARLTRLGRALRAASIDELPQLWNVLRGEMSLVGPRPLIAEYLPRYTPFQMRRHEVKPGITGWVQVHGRNALSWERRFELDVWYVDHQSLRLDALIVLKTVMKLAWWSRADSREFASVPEFAGSGAAADLR